MSAMAQAGPRGTCPSLCRLHFNQISFYAVFLVDDGDDECDERRLTGVSPRCDVCRFSPFRLADSFD